MRILIVTPLLPPEPGGPSYYSVHLRDALIKKGHAVSTLAFREVRRYPSIIRHVIFFFKVLRRLRGVEGVIVLDTVSVALPAVLAGALARKKTVVRVGGDFVWERFVERTGEKVLLSEFYTEDRALSRKERFLLWVQKNIVLPCASCVVFNTEWQRALWSAPYTLALHKTGVVHNAFEKRERAHRGGGGFLCAWRPTAFKNTDTLLLAHELLKKTHPEAVLHVYKNIPRDELYAHMAGAHALVIPSLSELSPNMAFEALRMGVPVLLTHDCGARDILDGAVTWIDPRSPEDIARKMALLLHPEAYEQAKKKAASFSYIHTYDDIADEFTRLLS